MAELCASCLRIDEPRVIWTGCKLPPSHDGPHSNGKRTWTDEHPNADRYVSTGQSYDRMPCH